MIKKINFIFPILLLALVEISYAQGGQKIYRMCVPQVFYQDCLDLLNDPSEAGIKMECIKGRDRLDCLELIQQNKADVLAVDPEDMYVAYHMKNQDFRVINEFRTKVEKDAEFRYEGVILIKKSSTVKTLKDLEGLKSCHTGFGRNVGYKIPITKLKNHGVMKVSMDPTISATERELKALSGFFSKSCLVGTYSPNSDVDKVLKKKYSNLCALCENPQQCNYPDKYSGYDGAIRCLDKGDGDVAFTKTSFIKKYFGLWHDGTIKAENNHPEDFEYLCEDGSRKPITGPACSWAQRPWKGYISNSDTVKEKQLLQSLQNRLDKFFENGLKAENKKAAKNLLIEPDLVLHDKNGDVKPKEYLERAGYKDVIERDGSLTHKIKLCVNNEIEFDKCQTLARAAFSRDIRPEFECYLSAEKKCYDDVAINGKADAVIVSGYKFSKILKEYKNLKPLVYERLDSDDVYVTVIDPKLTSEQIQKLPIKYDKSIERSRNAAIFLNLKRGNLGCDNLDENVQDDHIQIVNSKDLNKYKDKMLLCLDNKRAPVTDFKTCNTETFLPNSVFVAENMSQLEKDSYIHAFTLLSDLFGAQGKLPDVFDMFSEFKGHKDVLFSDHALSFVTETNAFSSADEYFYDTILKCQ
ncbi:transferrin-like [Condylostylus longicornis]|uniref:transferrin-like n=1 Tax=Condylostylus longicornis TaxID=2530218 RepID=UPI00244DFD39|nr:transferrin-like [Condylostylus longicornis]